MADSSTGGEDVFNVDRIRRLIDLMKEYDLSEVDLKQSEQQIRLVRGGVAPIMSAPVAMPAMQMPSAQPAASAAGTSAGGRRCRWAAYCHHQIANGRHLLHQGQSKGRAICQGRLERHGGYNRLHHRSHEGF